MGTDIYAQSGVVIPAAEAVDTLIPKMSRSEIKALRPTLRELIAEFCEEAHPAFVDEAVVDKLTTAVEGLKTTTQLRALVVDMIHASVSDDHVHMTDRLSDIIATIAGPKIMRGLPDFTFDYFASGRIAGYDVPIGVPCIVFSSEGLFKQVLTPAGKKLAKALKRSSVAESTWTVWSY